MNRSFTNRFSRFAMMVLVSVFVASFAHAQDATSDDTPPSPNPPPINAQPQPAAAYATGPAPAKSSGAAASGTPQSLCPDVDVMKRAAPGDISGVQADIERLNLCVERAKLLEQLDTVVIARQKELKKITDPDEKITGSITTGLGAGIPPLPIGDLPPLARGQKGDNDGLKNLKPGEVRIRGTAGNAFDKASQAVADWQIRKIWGQGAGMHAQIIDGATILNVVQGDPLPDGGTIETVSVKGVAVSRNGKINDLSWEQLSDSTSSGSPSNAKIIP